MTTSCWRLRARRRAQLIAVELALLDAAGDVLLWHDALPVTVGREREALTCARLVSAASRGAISRGRVLRCISAAEQRAA